MWRRSLQPHALNLVRVLPVDNAAWISARISNIPQLSPSLRYWIELRDDVLILYPAAHLLIQHQTLLNNPPKDASHYTLNPIRDTTALETLPPDHILSIAELVPTAHVVTFVLPTVRITCRQQLQTICIRGTRMRASAAHLFFDSVATLVRWRDDLNRAIFRDRKRLSDFRVLRHVGKGASGRVYEIEDKVTMERLALKVIEKTTVFESKDTFRHAMDERLVLQIIRHHPYILEMRYAFQNAKRLFLVTEFCSGGDLFEYMNRRVSPLDEHTARFISAQVLLALAHLHRLGIVYRDLKLENILIDDHGNVRLADFGLTKVLRQHDGSLARTNTFCGTREYVAPEMLRGDSYDTSLDFWTFGILLYEMMAGRTPFYTSDHSEIYRRIEKAPVLYPRHLSPEARSLLSKLLVRDPANRLGATNGGVKAICNHPWYKSIDWDGLMDRDSFDSPLRKTATFQQRRHENRMNTSGTHRSHLHNSRSNHTPHRLHHSPLGGSPAPKKARPKHHDDVHLYYKPGRRKTRKEIKQERAFANVLADVQADLRYASTRYEKTSMSAGSFSGSLLGLGRPRTPMGRSGNLVLAGYSFYDMQQRRAISENVAGTLTTRSSSAIFSSRSRWLLDGEGEDPCDIERNLNIGEFESILDDERRATTMTEVNATLSTNTAITTTTTVTAAASNTSAPATPVSAKGSKHRKKKNRSGQHRREPSRGSIGYSRHGHHDSEEGRLHSPRSAGDEMGSAKTWSGPSRPFLLVDEDGIDDENDNDNDNQQRGGVMGDGNVLRDIVQCGHEEKEAQPQAEPELTGPVQSAPPRKRGARAHSLRKGRSISECPLQQTHTAVRNCDLMLSLDEPSSLTSERFDAGVNMLLTDDGITPLHLDDDTDSSLMTTPNSVENGKANRNVNSNGNNDGNRDSDNRNMSGVVDLATTAVELRSMDMEIHPLIAVDSQTDTTWTDVDSSSNVLDESHPQLTLQQYGGAGVNASADNVNVNVNDSNDVPLIAMGDEEDEEERKATSANLNSSPTGNGHVSNKNSSSSSSRHRIHENSSARANTMTELDGIVNIGEINKSLGDRKSNFKRAASDSPTCIQTNINPITSLTSSESQIR